MALQFKPTIPPEGIPAVCISVVLCEECNEFDTIMFQLNESVFSIKTICDADKLCNSCWVKSFSEVSE